MIEVRAGLFEDIDRIAVAMRAADAAEVWAFAELGPYSALRASCENSFETWAVTQDGRPICMFGVVQHDNCAQPWALGTDEIEDEASSFLKHSIIWRDNLLAKWHRLSNWTDDRHAQSHRWLTWLGFTLGDPQPAGLLGMPFRPFWMERS